MNSLLTATPAPRPRARPRRTPARQPSAAAADQPQATQVLSPSRPDGGSHALGLGSVVLVHLAVGYALASGLAQKVVDSVRAPIEARLIQEATVKPPPPPEPPAERPKPLARATALPPPTAPFVPPPEVQAVEQAPAPAIAAVTPVAPVETHTEPPAAPVQAAPPPVQAAAPAPVAISVACPSMVAPVLPRRAQLDNIAGQVKARATISGGKVVDVQILSSTPRGVFDAAVKAAMLQYGCNATGSGEIVAVQNFQFRAAE